MGAQSSKDHVTVDQYDVTDDNIDDVKSALRGVVEKYRDEREKSNSSGDEFEVHFKGDADLLNCKDLVLVPDFRSHASTIETFRQRAAVASPGSFGRYNNRGTGAAVGAVTGSFQGPKKTKVALVSCKAVGDLRHLLERSTPLNRSRGDHMPVGHFVAHMTIGQGDDEWPVAMDRLKRNIGVSGLGRSGGKVVWSVPRVPRAEAEEETLLKWSTVDGSLTVSCP